MNNNSLELRKLLIDLDTKKILMSKFDNSVQKSDIRLPINCNGFGRIHHFEFLKNKNWMSDPLPQLAVKRQFSRDVDVESTMNVEIFQIAACNFNCWYCFVDKSLRNCDKTNSEFVRPESLLNCIKNEQSIPRIVSLSGGQPDLAPEYQLWFLKARENLCLENEIFIWADDNLSTDFIWRFLDSAELEYIVNKKNYARVGCLKGFDNDSCNFNTGVMRENLLDEQIYILKRLVSIGFEQYAYITLTSIDIENVYDKISYLFDKIQTLICEKFLLRIIPLEIFKYNVNCSRIVKEALCNQYKVVDCWKKLLTERFNSKELSDNYIIF